MDREVILREDGDETHIGYVSDFLNPRGDSSVVFDRICDAIEIFDLDGAETDPIIITIS